MTLMATPQRRIVRVKRHAQRLWPGISISVLIAGTALLLTEHYGAPVMLFAILIGMAVNFFSRDGGCKPGIDFVARHVLRWGVALLGLKITLLQIESMGWLPVLMVIVAVFITIIFGIGVAMWMELPPFLGLISGGAVGICGASAALAIAAVFPQHPHRERATIFVVISVSTLSTIAMFVYPMLMQKSGWSPQQAGLFLGGTIHDVAQVVGAGYSMGNDTGDAATVIKMMRVLMLAPVVVLTLGLMLMWLPRSVEDESSNRPSRGAWMPFFSVAFVLLVLANSFFEMPKEIVDAGSGLSKIFLVSAMAAIGMKTQVRDILSVGVRPFLLVLLETCFLACVVFVFIQWSVTASVT